MSENSSPLDLSTLWVECKNADGRTYFYNAKTRQTTWIRPEGQRVMSQSELDQLHPKPPETSTNSVSPSASIPNNPKPETTKDTSAPSGDEPTPANYNPYSYPPPSFGMPFGGIPPHLMPHMAQMMQNGFSGFGSIPPPAHLLRFMMPPAVNPTAVTAGKSLETLQTELRKLRVQLKEQEEKMLKVNVDAAVWSEFKNPEGRAYFYNSKTTESRWDKPLVLNDVIDVQNQLEQINKTMHESEKELKRLESEQSQLALSTSASNDKQSAQAQTQVVAAPSFINGFTLEKLDNNDLRRFGEVSLTSDRIGGDEKVKGRARPISNKPIPGTPWCIVWTSDNQAFFFNPTSRSSRWDRPEELKGRIEVDEMIRAFIAEREPNTASQTQTTKQKLDPTITDGEPDAKKLKSDAPVTLNPSNGSETESTEMNVLQTITDSSKNERPNGTKETALEAEVKASKQRELITYETRIKQFHEMLAEKQVSAFATWEQELSKISSDPRYYLLTAKERKQEYDRYTHERADEERKEKEAKLKQKKQDYRDLLKDFNVSIKTTFTEFSSRHTKDERFRAVEKIRDRENWFHEYVQELKTRGKEAANRPSDKETLKKDYFSLLKELKVNKTSSWSETKRAADHDARYKAVDSSSRREDWFREYQNKHLEDDTTTAPANEEELEQQREKERQERIDASIKKRTEEVKEQLSGVQREMDKEREQVKKEKFVQNFKAFLTDMVRTADAEWREIKKTLKKDPRWTRDLNRDEKETLFDEHVTALEKKRQAVFHAILSEHTTLTSSWKDVKKTIKADPRFEKIFSNERKRDLEREFEKYIKDQYRTAKDEFKELLKETKVITYKSLQMIRESEEQNHLRDVEKILQKDQRYLLLDVIPEERSNILMDYLKDLEQRGVPPPPTASLDRRKV